MIKWKRWVDLNHRPLGYEPAQGRDSSLSHTNRSKWNRDFPAPTLAGFGWSWRTFTDETRTETRPPMECMYRPLLLVVLSGLTGPTQIPVGRLLGLESQEGPRFGWSVTRLGLAL
jgi:hypothetical protein